MVTGFGVPFRSKGILTPRWSECAREAGLRNALADEGAVAIVRMRIKVRKDD